MTLNIQRLTSTAVLPSRGTDQSAGLDLRADLTSPVTLPPGGSHLFSTGLAIALPEGTVGLVFGRSGLGIRHGLVPSNAVGVIDADYRGEVMVGLRNLSQTPYTVEPGERIAQLVVLPALFPDIAEAPSLGQTARGTGGFGSTGRE
ncbi:MAG: dUTP diphosphatase [Oscillospiraceae bacterium]|nr:MAG: dUTP diphosphatase [Oscillospiraceae bacterium]